MADKKTAFKVDVSDLIWNQLAVATEIHDLALIHAFNLLLEFAESFEEYGVPRESHVCNHSDTAIISLATSIANMTYDKMKMDGVSIDGFSHEDRQIHYDKTGKVIDRTRNPFRVLEGKNG